MSAESRQKMIGAKVDPNLHKEVRVAAAKREMSISEYLREVLEESVSDE